MNCTISQGVVFCQLPTIELVWWIIAAWIVLAWAFFTDPFGRR